MKKFFCILCLIIFCGVLTMNNPACANYKIIEKNGKKGLVYDNKIVVPLEYDNILDTNTPYYYKYYIIEKNSKKGLVYRDKIAIPAEYDNVFVNNSEYILVKDDIIKTSYGKTYKIKNFNPSSVAIIRDEWIFSKFRIGYHIEYDDKRTDKTYSILKVLLLPIDIPIAIIKKPIDKFINDWNKQWM